MITGGTLFAMLLTRDEPKRATNLQVHGLDFADARDRFEWDSALVSSTYPIRHGGARFAAIGFLDGAVVTLVFSLFGTEAISAISLRTASNKERRRYEQG